MTVPVSPPYLTEPVDFTKHGFRESVKGASPAAATDYSVTLSPRYVTLLESVFVRLVCDATVANREVVLEYQTNEALRFAVFGAPVVATASQTVDYVFVAGPKTSEWPIDSTIMVGFTPLPLVGSEIWKLHIVNAQAADQLSRIRWTVRRFFTDSTR